MHQMLEDSIPAPIHATSPNCHNDHASEGAYGFSVYGLLPVCKHKLFDDRWID